MKSVPEVIKLFFMLNSVEHKILKAHKYKNIKKVGFLLGSDKPRMLFYPLIIVGNNCWHFNIYDEEKFHV